jgi:hypothetical protein
VEPVAGGGDVCVLSLVLHQTLDLQGLNDNRQNQTAKKIEKPCFSSIKKIPRGNRNKLKKKKYFFISHDIDNIHKLKYSYQNHQNNERSHQKKFLNKKTTNQKAITK